ncbi:hemicentin-1 isoform X2 [Austrofundulus limnaeus]|uniref:Hemicentin-1 isoform X2 n=1 Tax=Austrofundulus limnaeus TaxID=52670 RepID=A0A2I4CLA9_AUSLI|nr:PREDICTED: hemicentin-1-like isoform X2 [Austrofundulus limnaeus]
MDLLSLNSLLFFLFLLGFCAGNSVLPPGPMDVVLGKNLTIKITVTKNPGDIVIWNFNDGKNQNNIATLRPDNTVNVGDAYKTRGVSVDPNTGSLTVTSLKKEDSGDYSVTLLQSAATVTGDVLVRVLVPVSNVVIKSDLFEAIEYNSTVVLTCSSSGSYLTFTWTNGTTPIVSDGKRLTVVDTPPSTDGGSSKLTITGVLRSDLVGPITCTAKNTMEQATSPPFNLTVYYGPDDVTISPLKPSDYITSSSDFNLTCAAPSSSPPATFTWYHNKDEIKASGPVLTLKTIEAQGFGKNYADYTCRAQNAKTLRAVASPAVRFSVMEPISDAKISGPTGILIAGNSSANVSCQATSGNVTQISWIKDGTPLSENSRIMFSSDKSSLFISVLQKEDNGNYVCKLRNSVSEKEASYKMAVSFGPEPFKVEGKDEVKISTEVVLICSPPSTPPANITWKLNGTLLNVKTNKLVIENALYKDSGTYTCEAFNPVTGKTTTSTHTLSVKEEIIEGLSDGAIAGIVIACLVAVGACLALFFYCRQKVPVRPSAKQAIRLESPY